MRLCNSTCSWATTVRARSELVSVVCEIKNDGPPFTGVVEVSPGDYGKGNAANAGGIADGHGQAVGHPGICRRALSLHVNVRLVDERGKLRAEQTALRPGGRLVEIP